MSLRVLALPVALAGALLCAAPMAAGTGQAPSVFDLLDRYDRGEFDRAVSGADSWNDDRNVVGTIRQVVPAWVDRGDERRAARRALVAAGWMVELAVRHLAWSDATVATLVVEGCTLVRERAPDDPQPLERVWHRLAAAMLSSASSRGPWTVLDGEPSKADGAPFGALRARAGPGGHLTHALARFPDDTRLQLTGVVARDVRTRGDVPMKLGFEPELEGVDIREVLSAITDDYERLRTAPDVGVEATLRLGETRLRLGQSREAASLFDEVRARTSDPVLVYMSRLFDGRLATLAGAEDAARTAYMGALTVVPNARSASLLLAAADFTADRPDRERATVLIDDLLDPPVHGADPWLIYRRGEGRYVQRYIRELREALQ